MAKNRTNNIILTRIYIVQKKTFLKVVSNYRQYSINY